MISGVDDNALPLFEQLLLGAGYGHIRRVPETGSTNADLLEAPFTDQIGPSAICWADHQTAGRGRRGQVWLDRQSESLTFSAAFEYRATNAGPTPIPAFALVAGVSILQSLKNAVPQRADRFTLKWPNDVLMDGAKLAGILVEARRQDGISRLVVGCGVNLRPPVGLQRGPLALPATGLLHDGDSWEDLDSQRLVADIGRGLIADFAAFIKTGFEPYRPAWESANAFAACEVVLSHDGQEIASGLCRGVDACGALQIESAGIIRGYSIGVLSARTMVGSETPDNTLQPRTRL